jgi:hypothetical protein
VHLVPLGGVEPGLAYDVCGGRGVARDAVCQMGRLAEGSQFALRPDRDASTFSRDRRTASLPPRGTGSALAVTSSKVALANPCIEE